MDPAAQDQKEDNLEQALWQLFINETRLHSERTSSFLIATAFLLTGFAILRQEAGHGIQFVFPAVGVLFTLLHFVNINYGETVIQLWKNMLQEGKVGYVVFGKRADLYNRTWWLKDPLGRLFTRRIGSMGFPALFFVMWVALVVFEAIR